jgi:Reverse transcriptase (RNA-dependent DNA polymerase)
MFDNNPEPKSYNETKQTQDFANWWAAMKTEFQYMEQKRVWEVLPKTSIAANRKVIGARWVYTKKADGRFRARCIAKRFSQIPGNDFQENHAPVVSDTTLHLLLAIKTAFKLSSGQFDIKTAFLYGELEEELWMAISDG